MKKILVGVLLLISLVVGGSAFAGDIRLGFAWDPNTEPDMKEYQVYRMIGTTPVPLADVSVCIVQHPTTQCLNNLIGNYVNMGTLQFYAVARDLALNTSGASNVVSYAYDFIAPAAPRIFRIVEILGINSLMFLDQELIIIG